LRTAFKRIVETAVLRGGAAAIGQFAHRKRALILAYHNILSPGARPGGDVSLHLPLEKFIAQLSAIQRSHEVVPLTELLSGSVPSTGKPIVVLTFDDAYRGAIQLGIPEIVRLGMPVTVFLCPGRLGSSSFWWDRYLGVDRNGLGPGFRDFALTRLGGREELVTEHAEERGWTGRGEPAHIGCATESELREVASMPGVTFGSHTWSHPNLVVLSDAEIEAELLDSRSWLEERFSNSIPCISYPYGLFDDRVTRTAMKCGFHSGLAISGGWMNRRLGPKFAVPRLNVPAGVSEAGFGLRLAGLFTT